MRAGLHNFTIQQGSTWTRRIDWTDADGVAVPITGYTARMHIRRRASDSSLLQELVSPGQITIDAAAGSLTLSLTAAETAALRAGEAVYDLEVVAPDGEVTRLLEGDVEVVGEVTR